MYTLMTLLAKKNSGEAWTAVIFIVITAVVALIGYVKKKMAENDQTTRTGMEEEDPAEVFHQYFQEDEDEEVEERPHIVVEPYGKQQRQPGKKSRRQRGKKHGQFEFETGREPGVTHRLVADVEAPGSDGLSYGATMVAMAEPVDLMKALPGRLTPNQKAIVLMEILSKPKGMEGI